MSVDVVIHQRGGKEPNLCAIELKRANQRGEDCDKTRLNWYLSKLNYQFAAYVEFPESKDPDSIRPIEFGPF